MVQLLDNSASFEVPNDDLCVFSCASDEPVAFADVDVSNVIEMAV
jgi:hypothetical protein